ncbi:MAG: amidohydrolase family protein [Deltaproteobacteria bacterium]|nr:amidohydrolase family protein [Deltaproteobacteria bacterium]
MSKPSVPKDVSKKVLVVDLIEDLVFRKERDGWTLTTPEAHVNVEKLKTGGVDLFVSAIPGTTGERAWQFLERALKMNDKLVAGAGGTVKLVSSFKAAREARTRGIIPMLVLLEGADVLVGRLDRLPDLRRRGLAIVGLVSGRNNAFAHAWSTSDSRSGLTEKGRELLEACRDNDIVVDLTHASQKTFWDVLVEQAGMVVISHTAVRTLRDHGRNLDDLQILALARYGGVMGLVFNPDFLKPGESATATLDDVVEHVMYVRAIGAVGAIALGTDYGGVRPPAGLEDVSRLPVLKEALKRQGLGDSEIAAIMGGNAVRLFEEVERERGAVRLTRDEILRPVALECDAVVGEYDGYPGLVCDKQLLDRGPTLPPASRQKIRLKDMSLSPVRLELFGEPGTPWQIEGQNLAGKILFTRVVALDGNGTGELSLPSRRNLTRLFCSPTRSSHLREAVVWGH